MHVVTGRLIPRLYFQARLNGPGNEARVHGYCSTTQLDYMQKTCKVRLVYKNQIRAKQETVIHANESAETITMKFIK